MTSILVVHGTGARGAHYAEMFGQIEEAVYNYSGQKPPQLEVLRCPWGDAVGAKLNQNGESIPNYIQLGGAAAQRNELPLWNELYLDPLFELRLLAFRPLDLGAVVPGQQPGQFLDQRIRSLVPTGEMSDALLRAGILVYFEEARKRVVNAPPYKEFLPKVPPAFGEYRLAIARAIIAMTMAICKENERSARILTDAKLRDKITDQLSKAFGDQQFGLGDFLGRILDFAARLKLTDYVQMRRGAITDATYPTVGDVILYQANGEPIRQFIYETIKAAKPPVVLLAHSLGGIACVDLLILNKLPEVKLLITVGSQAPFLYEINALQSLTYGKPLPDYFPPWMNIFDFQDNLSYIGKYLFPNRVTDILVDNGQPFSRSHSSYWSNDQMWNKIADEMRVRKLI